MKEKPTGLSSKNKKLRQALLLNIIVLFVLVLLFYPRFQSKADIMMQSILYGVANKKASSHLLFSNVLIGYLLKGLVSVLPHCPWYTIFHYFCAFLALWGISYVTMKQNKGYMGIVIAAVVEIFLGYECYIMPGYIRTAALLSAAGGYLIFYYIRQENRKFSAAIAGIGLCILGSMVSFRVFAIATAIGILLFMINYMILGQQWGRLKQYGVLMLIVLGISGVLFGVDRYTYYSEDYLTDASEYRNSIEQILGYGSPDYKEEYGSELDLNKKGYALLVNGIFVPKQDQDLDRLQYVSQDVFDISFSKVNRFFKEIPIGLFKTGMFYCCLILGSMLIFSQKTYWKYVVINAVVVMNLALLSLFLWVGIGYSWVYAIVFYPICIFMLMGIRDIHKMRPQYLAVAFVLAGLVLYNLFSSTLIGSINEENIAQVLEERETDAQDKNKNKKEVYYVLDLDTYLQQFSVFQAYPKGLLDHEDVYIANGCYAILPEFERYMLSEAPSKENGRAWLYRPDWIQESEIP